MDSVKNKAYRGSDMKQTGSRAGVLGGWRKVGLPAVLATAVVAGACHYIGQDDKAGLQTVTVTRGDLQKSITAVGSIEPKDYVDVGTQVSGRVMKIHVDIGDRVAKGDLIAEIDPTVYESTVRKDRATLENLKAQLEQQLAESALAATQLKRNQEMRAADAVSQTTVDEADAQAKVAAATVSATRAQIRASEATLEGDLANLGYTKIYAPLDDTVVSQTTLEGQTVNASQSAPVIVQVANMDVMTVWAQVAEADVSRIAVGMPAHFTTLGMPDKKWEGKVRAVYPTPEVENDVVLYNVLIDVDNRQGQLLPQMTVQVFFTLGEAKDVPLAPINALQAQHDAGPSAYKAKVLTDDGVVERDVKIGLTNRSMAQVVSGLLPGDQLIVANAVPPAAGAAQGGRMRQMGPRL
jgi:macrolide-specific efflux system membrane fusion protein